MSRSENQMSHTNGGREGGKFDYAQRVLGEKVKEMQEKVERVELQQRDFIYKIARDLTPQNRELLNTSKAYIGEFFEKKFNQLGSVVRGSQGTQTRGLQFDGKIGEASCCAERRGLFNFKKESKPGETVDAIATARRDEVASGEHSIHYTESVGPCGLCRDALSSLNDQAEVIQPIGGEIKSLPVSFLYPSRKFLRGDKEMTDDEKAYRELLLQISDEFPVTDSDQRMITEAFQKLSLAIESEGKNQIVVAASGFSGEIYTNSTPKLTRNPQSLIIDRPVEFQLVCEASENHDQLLTLIVVKDSKDENPQIMLPAGVSRELIRQFHPLTTVIVDFGKEGFKKLPIEVLYPLVYKLRKRKKDNQS